MGNVLPRSKEAEAKNRCRIIRCVDTSNEDIKKGNVFINSPLGASDNIDMMAGEALCDVLMEPDEDRRKLVNSFKDSDMHSGTVKLKITFPGESPGADDQVCFGTGQIMNMVLADGKLSDLFIQSAAHNFIIRNNFKDGSKDLFRKAKSVTAYFHMNGEDDEGNPIYEEAIPVIKYCVYENFFDNPCGHSGFDYAIASIKFPPKSVAAPTLNGRFSTLPALAWELAKGQKILVSGFAGEGKRRYQLLEMQGTIHATTGAGYKVVKTDSDHGLILYRNIDTSTGQSGAMITLVEETSTVLEMLLVDNKWTNVRRYLLNGGQWALDSEEPPKLASSIKSQVYATNIGVHSMVAGGVNTVNVGTLLTPSIIDWTRKQITSGHFWEGKESEIELTTSVGCGTFDIDELKKNYEEALQLNREDTKTWIDLGKIGGGMSKSRKQCYEKALKLDPKNIMAWRKLSKAGGGLGKSSIKCELEASRLEELEKS